MESTASWRPEHRLPMPSHGFSATARFAPSSPRTAGHLRANFHGRRSPANIWSYIVASLAQSNTLRLSAREGRGTLRLSPLLLMSAACFTVLIHVVSAGNGLSLVATGVVLTVALCCYIGEIFR